MARNVSLERRMRLRALVLGLLLSLCVATVVMAAECPTITFEADSHLSSPSVITPNHRGGSYLKRLQMEIATEPTLIPCVTEMEVTNQTPGAFRAYVTPSVRAPNGAVVIPQGAFLVMQPAGQTIVGDERMGVNASTLTFPDGRDLKRGRGIADNA
jgi:hypothetical protein